MIPFGRILQEGDKGSDVKGVKRALTLAGQSGFTSSETFGPFTTAALKRFQKTQKLKADGIYGPVTHKALTPFFDEQARLWYVAQHEVLQLPETFVPTHQTDGLPGYPAVDVFAPGGTVVRSPATGVVDKLSGHPITPKTTPGGPYGWSIYITSTAGPSKGGRYFLTHFEHRYVTWDQKVKKGEVIGVVADYAKATGGKTPSHIHMGFHKAGS